MACAAPHNPPFRADHVGSFLRPAELLNARADHEAGKITAARLRAIEDEAIGAVVKFQESVGLQSITDGEYRRAVFYTAFYSALGDLAARYDTSGQEWSFVDRAGNRLPLIIPEVRSRLRWRGPIHVGDFDYIRSLTTRTPKITIPSPTILHLRAGRAHISRTAYPDLDLFWEDIVDAFHKELRALADAGCRYVQIDETTLASLSDTTSWEYLRERGEDGRKLLLETYPEIMNRAFGGRPPGLHLAMHICRGNNQSYWSASGGYDLVADVLFNRINVDSYFLEYDTPRAGTFEPLRFVPRHKTVVLGLVSTKFDEMETKDGLKRRIDEAAKYLDLDQLSLSPQCGFASTAPGNRISLATQEAKLRLVVEVAREVWGD
ncbi:MAG TPA: 5-methyltetrahydropteroyltriglutamate--homocysteine S-methyltransferase [Candidatus Binataceae bacterium]|jgi:5-methyltetrahydropteroyltriglutamate--homocysteine methyltransferase|nr:5-methyltetrahydropteroyltriglutamate--homocysteine S-methyltransferase [Candidatus Binataceae bacterium]